MWANGNSKNLFYFLETRLSGHVFAWEVCNDGGHRQNPFFFLQRSPESTEPCDRIKTFLFFVSRDRRAFATTRHVNGRINVFIYATWFACTINDDDATYRVCWNRMSYTPSNRGACPKRRRTGVENRGH